jgi:hypothetical protein
MTKRLAILACLYFFNAATAMAIEEPEFEILLEGEGFEVRQYAPYIVAEVDVRGNFGDAGNEAFRILAAYIFGDNETSEEMQMTAPVQSSRKGEGIRMAMTAPVTSGPPDKEDDIYRFGFVMERKYTMETIPKPKDSRIRLRLQEPKIVAVRRYSGLWTQKNYQQNESEMLASLATAGIKPCGEPILARYNSPFTPWFLRRNEVMVEVEWDR